MAHPQIAAFARLAEENSTPTRLLAGQKTLMARTMHDIRYDEVNDELLVTNPFAGAILVFEGGANGEEPPIRVIQGRNTNILAPDRLEVDPVNDEILIPEGNRILVFSRTANGDVAPLRILEGPDTAMRNAESVVVDAVHDLLIVGTQDRRATSGGGSLLIFNRTDEGNVKPRAIIHGPKTGIIRINQMAVYPPKSWIIASMPGRQDMRVPGGVFIGVWSIHDNGDVPPRWKIGGPKSGMKKPRGVALNPKHKEIIVADMALNSVLTFYFPEIF
ncbi:MAG: hypothetical protein IH935_11140 [Acidobacteria bacterium]|nr:hypothetical protein [Acidobacteriota bacterium]